MLPKCTNKIIINLIRKTLHHREGKKGFRLSRVVSSKRAFTLCPHKSHTHSQHIYIYRRGKFLSTIVGGNQKRAKLISVLLKVYTTCSRVLFREPSTSHLRGIPSGKKAKHGHNEKCIVDSLYIELLRSVRGDRYDMFIANKQTSTRTTRRTRRRTILLDDFARS